MSDSRQAGKGGGRRRPESSVSLWNGLIAEWVEWVNAEALVSGQGHSTNTFELLFLSTREVEEFVRLFQQDRPFCLGLRNIETASVDRNLRLYRLFDYACGESLGQFKS